MPHVATCPECNKRFRVADPAKTYRCKNCQVDLIVQPKEPEPESGEGESDQGEADDAPKKRPSRSSRRESNDGGDDASADRKARSAARKELAKLDWLRVALLLLLGLAVIEFLFNLIRLGDDGQLLNDGEPLPTWAKAFGIAVTSIPLVLYFMAWKSLGQRNGKPLLWVLALAFISTVIFVVERMYGPMLSLFTVIDFFFWDISNGKFPRGVSRGIFTLGLWYCAIVASRIERIRKENPSAFAEEIEHGSATQSLRRRDRTAKQGNHRLQLIIAGLLTLIAVGGFLAWKSSQPSNPEGTVEDFREAWNLSDQDALSSLARPSKKSKWERTFKRFPRKYEWDSGFPKLGDFIISQRSATTCSVAFDGEEGGMDIYLTWLNGRWTLTGLDPTGFDVR